MLSALNSPTASVELIEQLRGHEAQVEIVLSSAVVAQDCEVKRQANDVVEQTTLRAKRMRGVQSRGSYIWEALCKCDEDYR